MRGTQIDFGSVDVNFDIATAVKIDGTFYSYGSGSGVSSLDAPAFSTSWSISSAQVTGFQQLFKASIVNGVGPIQITSTGNNANPAVTPDNTAVVYSTDRFGDRRLMYQLLAGSAMSTEYAVSALTSFVMIGDSLTAGVGASPSTDGFAYLIAANFARAYTIAARGGQTSRQIATRVGALAVTATVSGNSIASGSNSITALNGVAIAPSSGTDYQWMSTPADDNTTTSTGTIMTSPPVHGTFTRTATGGPPSTAEAYSFTPDAGYSLPIACAANTPIVLDTLTYDQQTVFICVGTNDFTNPSQVIASITALVAWYKPLVKKLMILTPLDLGQTVNSQTGGSLNTAISSLCATILSTWPNYAVDVRTPLLDGTGKIATANIDSGSGHPDNAGHALMAAAAIASATTRNF